MLEESLIKFQAHIALTQQICLVTFPLDYIPKEATSKNLWKLVILRNLKNCLENFLKLLT